MTMKSIDKRADEVLRLAKNLVKKKVNCIEAHNAIFGPGCLGVTNFPTAAERLAFTKTKQFDKIKEMFAGLQQPKTSGLKGTSDVSGRLLVRLPLSLHASLLAEAESEAVSVNQLIVAKLSAQLAAVV